MAKRKRLTAPDPSQIAPPKVNALDVKAPETKALETKAMDIPTGYAPDHMPRSLSARAPIADVAGQASVNAALEKVASELTSARTEGRLVQKLPLSAINGVHMTRDRVVIDADEMESLQASLAARGQQTPIEVVETAPGRYGLISGWRRLSALRTLEDRGGVSTVLALVRAPQEASDAYTAMVEENEIRVGLTYFERANIVLKSIEEGVFRSEKEALNSLFASASRAKRSKIKSFLPVVETIGGWIQYPGALTERLGLALSARITEDPAWGARLYDRLRKANVDSVEEETALLQKALDGAGGPVQTGPKSAKPESKPAQAADAEPVTLTRSKSGLRLSGPGLSDALVAEIEALVRAWKP